MILENKIALITGGSRGIGRAIAKRFQQEGAQVIVVSKQVENLRKIQDELNCPTYQMDVSDTEQVQAVYGRIIEEQPPIDILVNNASVCDYHDFLDVSVEDFQRTLDTNLIGHYFLSQSVARDMIKKGIKGSIINVGSVNSYFGSASQTDYCISKGGILMMTRSLAISLGEHGIRVNMISPGIVITDINKETYSDPNLVDKKIARIPLRRFGEKDEIANAVTFLASDQASYITGSSLMVDGGLHSSY